MKNRKILLSVIILVAIIIIGGYLLIKYVNKTKENEMKNEYIPEEEISKEQLRETIVSLYFPDKETNIIKPEARVLNVKELIQSPYSILIELLINGPKNEKLKNVFPENTKLINSEMNGECLILDFSNEILSYEKEDEKSKENMICSIVNTVTELNEVNTVKILINGEENEEFNEKYFRK